MRPYDYYGEFTREFFGHMNPDDLRILQSVFGVLIGIIVFVVVASLVFYILQAIGIMRMAGNRGMSCPWMGWIPVLNTFMIGALADDINEKQNGSKSYFRFFLLGGVILSYVISGTYLILMFTSLADIFRSYGRTEPGALFGLTPLINLLQYPISIAILVLTLISLNKIYKCYSPKSATAYTVLSFFFSFLISIFLFALRNREPVPVWQPAPGYYPPPPSGYPPMGYPPSDYPLPGYPPADMAPPYQQGYAPPPAYPSPPVYPPQNPIYPPAQGGDREEPPAK